MKRILLVLIELAVWILALIVSATFGAIVAGLNFTRCTT